MKRKSVLFAAALTVGLICLNILAKQFFLRIDLTSEKRFSISENTRNLMRSLKNPAKINIYLDGELNPGFLRLRNSLKEMLDEFDIYAATEFKYSFINPSKADSESERNKTYTELEKRGLNPTTIYERDSEGKSIQKTVFPWAEIIVKNDTFSVNLLKNIPGNSGSENLNVSIENLEFEITDAFRILNAKEVQKIAFIEGHGELQEDFVYDISMAFSRYFQVDRGFLGTDATILDNYKAIVVAKPESAFSEADKYIIDQYIMKGGRVLWLVDGIRMSMQQLSETGESPAIAAEANLNDMLFRYGVRINPVLIQDVQCVQMPMNVSATTSPQYEPMPWYFSPLLLASPYHPVTRNLTQVKADFCSTIDLTNEDAEVKKTILLATSTATHLIQIPTVIKLTDMPDGNDEKYFNLQLLPVAAALEGKFTSVFQNRLIPEKIEISAPTKTKSQHTRMVVIADGDIIRNEIASNGKGYQALPVGFDRYSGIQFGNREFILNALLYLTDDENWISLRNRTFKVRMLNKMAVSSGRTAIQWTNLLLPIALLLLFGAFYLAIRRLKYRK